MHLKRVTLTVVHYIKWCKFKFKFKFLTADKGVALVVMDRANILTNVWPFSMTLRSSNLARTLPRNSTETSRNPFESSTENMELQDYMIGANSTTTNCSPQVTHPLYLGFMVYQKYTKLTAPCAPIVSACGTATYQLAKFLTKILQRYTGITLSFVKDSKSFSEHLRLVHISEDEELVSFDVSAHFTSIPVPTALDVINHLFCEHIKDPEAKHKYGCSFKRNTIGLENDEVMQLLKLVLENCVFTFQDKFFKTATWCHYGFPCSPVVANIYMEYFEELALGPELPIPVKDWKRYVDDVFNIIPKGNRNTMLQYLNSIDPHIKFTIEQPNEKGAFLSWTLSQNPKVRA